MAFILGETTLPYPNEFSRVDMEKGTFNRSISGVKFRRLENIKEKYELIYENIKGTVASQIVNQYNQQEVKRFQVTDGNLTVDTDVHIDVMDVRYLTKGVEYLASLTLILTEVI